MVDSGFKQSLNTYLDFYDLIGFLFKTKLGLICKVMKHTAIKFGRLIRS
jgi:hypothetical protein